MRARRLHATSLGSEAKWPRDRLFATLTPAEARALLYEWPFWARANQLPPDGEWRVWLVLAGRGFDTTRTGAEMIRARVAARMAHRLALVAPTAGDARDVMVEGESGILAISPPWERPRYEPSKRRLTWPMAPLPRSSAPTSRNAFGGRSTTRRGVTSLPAGVTPTPGTC